MVESSGMASDRTTATRAAARLIRVAEALSQRLTDLLNAPIAIVDQRDVVVASSDPDIAGLPFARAGEAWRRVLVRVPARPNGYTVDVVVGQPRDDEVLSPRLVSALIDLAVNQPVSADRSHEEQHERKDHFIYDLLHSLLTDETTILREARVLGINLSLPRSVILIEAGQYILARANELAEAAAEADIQQRAQYVIAIVVDCFQLPSDAICSYIGDGEIVVLKASDTRNLQPWVARGEEAETSNGSINLGALKRAGAELLGRLQTNTGTALSLALGRYHPGVTGLARSYQDARAALSLGLRFQGQNRVHCLDELGIAAFVGIPDEQTKIELSTHLLGPLNDYPELIQTLKVFFAENCLPSATAQHLSIHRNTLSHRLSKIAALSGLDPRRFDDAVQIRLALLLRDLQARYH